MQWRKNINVHVMPQHLSCPFCLVDFDAVGRMESFAEDVAFVLKKNHMKVRGREVLSDQRCSTILNPSKSIMT